MSIILDILTQSSGMSLDELHARSRGDIRQTANELAALVNGGMVRIQSASSPPLVAGGINLRGQLVDLLSSNEVAESVHVLPTAYLYKTS